MQNGYYYFFIHSNESTHQDDVNLMTAASVQNVCGSPSAIACLVFNIVRHAVLLPQDYNDEIRQEQLRELSLLNGSDESSRGRNVQGRSIRATTTVSNR